MAFAYFDGPLIAAMVSLYGLGRYTTHYRWSYVGVGGAIALVGFSELSDLSFTIENAIDLLEPILLVPILLWYIGKRVRIRGDYIGLLRDRAAHAEREQAAESRRAVAEERVRIARELHDVVAHRVSLMTVQAGAATTVAANDPESALRAMQAIESEGRQALAEMRHLMGVLRPRTEAVVLEPQSGIADVPRLIQNLQKAGLDISLTMDTTETKLPAAVELSAFRIVQEALTNVLRHAGPGAKAEVRICAGSHQLLIDVINDGQSVVPFPGTGHGIIGMRERAQLLGGSLEAGPGPRGGFQVIAVLPISEQSA